MNSNNVNTSSGKQNNDKETISRLREALANMNKDYMQTKLELDQISSAASPKPDLGSHLLKFSSKVKAFQSNIKLQINNLNEYPENVENNQKQKQDQNQNQNQNHISNDIKTENTQSQQTNKEIRRLRDDTESLQIEIKQLKKMLKQSMEEKDGLQKERNELLIKYGEAHEEIKRLKEQSISDANRYEQLLDAFRAENTSQIEMEKKKLYKECDDKINALSANCTASNDKYEELQNKWKQNEENWNNKFDLIVTERNSLKRKVKSLQNDLSEYIKYEKDKYDSGRFEKYEQETKKEQQQEEELKLDHDRKTKQIKQLKADLIDLKKTYENEKISLLNSIQRLSSKSNVHSKGANMQFLVNSLSALITEKEDIIESLKQSKRYLGHRVIELENEVKQNLKDKE